MTSLEAYNNYLIKINKNDTNRNIKVNKGQFVSLYNQQAPIWLKNRIDKDIHSDEIDDIGELLEMDIEFEKLIENANSTDFKAPDNYFEYSSSYSLAQKPGCAEAIIYHWNSKNKNKNTLLISDNHKPSFEYQETFITDNGRSIKVYRDNFSINRLFVDYYRLPETIDVEGYIKVDGSHSSTVNPTISDYLINQILNHCVLETIRIYESPEGYVLAKDRIENEINK